MFNSEENPAIIRFTIASETQVPAKISNEIPKRYKGDHLKEADVTYVSGAFGSFFHQQVIDRSWVIDLINLSTNKPITLRSIAQRPMVTICSLLKGSTSSKLKGYGDIFLQRNRYTFYYIPPQHENALAFDAGESQMLYFSFSNDFVSKISAQHPRFLELFNSQKDYSEAGIALPIFKIGIEERKILDAVKRCTLKGIAKHVYLHARILDLLVRYFASLDTAETNQNQTYDQHNRLLESQKYIQENYFLPLKIETLSRRAGINLRTYERAFKEIFTTGPREYIEQVRGRKAAELLKTTTIPVTSIGHQVGFTGRNYFSTVFRKIYGCSPREYRKKWVQNDSIVN
jgi:AraC-like DNA-binding protein